MVIFSNTKRIFMVFLILYVQHAMYQLWNRFSGLVGYSPLFFQRKTSKTIFSCVIIDFLHSPLRIPHIFSHISQTNMRITQYAMCTMQPMVSREGLSCMLMLTHLRSLDRIVYKYR